MQNLAPIVLFCYNRPDHAAKTLEALSQNDLAAESILYIFCDGAKPDATAEQIEKIQKTRAVAKSKQWCKEVYIKERDTNIGLADSIIEGVTAIVNQYGKVIVLEDDLISAKGFLKYMNEALNLYQKDEKVMQVSAYNFPTTKMKSKKTAFFLNFTTSWGWATWKESWDQFIFSEDDYKKMLSNPREVFFFNLENHYNYGEMLKSQMEGRVNSWAIRWWFSVFKNKGLVLYPDNSLIYNIGFGPEATHTKESTFVNLRFLENYEIEHFPTKISISRKKLKIITSYIKYKKDISIKTRCKNIISKSISVLNNLYTRSI